MKRHQDILVVDGYNVIYKSPRYASLIDEGASKGISLDPYIRARELLIGDVAAYAQGKYDPYIVFDAAKNLSPDRPNYRIAGVRVIFSRKGESADTVIERLVTQARHHEVRCLLVTSDNTIRSTVGTGGVSKLGADTFISNVKAQDKETSEEAVERSYAKMTLADTLNPETRAALNKLLGRG